MPPKFVYAAAFDTIIRKSIGKGAWTISDPNLRAESVIFTE